MARYFCAILIRQHAVPSLEQTGLTLGGIVISPLVTLFVLTGTEGTDKRNTAKRLYYDLATAAKV